MSVISLIANASARARIDFGVSPTRVWLTDDDWRAVVREVGLEVLTDEVMHASEATVDGLRVTTGALVSEVSCERGRKPLRE